MVPIDLPILNIVRQETQHRIHQHSQWRHNSHSYLRRRLPSCRRPPCRHRWLKVSSQKLSTRPRNRCLAAASPCRPARHMHTATRNRKEDGGRAQGSAYSDRLSSDGVCWPFPRCVFVCQPHQSTYHVQRILAYETPVINIPDHERPEEWTWILSMTIRQPESGYKDLNTPQERRRAWDPRAEQFAEPFRSAMLFLPGDTVFWSERLMQWPTVKWENSRGPVTLAGDAAHPMTYRKLVPAFFWFSSFQGLLE